MGYRFLRPMTCYLGLGEQSYYLQNIQLIHFTQLGPPKGGRGCLMSPPCLESQGCHLIPRCYLLSCSSA